MHFVIRRNRLALVVAALAVAISATMAVVETREFREVVEEERQYQSREIQEGLSSLHRDLQMINHLTGGHSLSPESQALDYVAARRDQLGPVRWLGFMHGSDERPHVLLASAEMRGYDPRRDSAVTQLINSSGEGTLAATMPGSHRERASLAVVMGPNDPGHPTLVALIDGNDFLDDALSALTHASAPLDLLIQGHIMGHWPHFPTHKEEHDDDIRPLSVATLEFTVAFARVDQLTVLRRVGLEPLLLLFGGLALAVLVWRSRSAATTAVANAPPSPPVAGADLHRQRLWQLGELAATLSHDLGQPLNVIRLTAEASQDAAAHGRLDDARLNRTLDNMVTQAMRAQGMIDALVQVTRRPSQPPAHLRPVEVVRGVLAELLPQLKAHGIALRWHADPATPTVLGHAPRLAAAVRHLVVNAVEALAGLPIERKGGTISVDCRAEGRSVVIVVADDGPGFPAALAPLLDNPLAPPSERGKGCGLGLALTLGIAAEMGGSLRLDDSVYGARLVLSLPQARRSVLVAEDDEAAAQELANYLEAKGWQVGLAHGGNPALALFERQAPDAVVTDLHMADGDGWTLIARLHGIAPDLPIIAISTADGEDARRAVTAGAALVLRKPVGLQDLYGELESLLDGP